MTGEPIGDVTVGGRAALVTDVGTREENQKGPMTERGSQDAKRAAAKRSRSSRLGISAVSGPMGREEEGSHGCNASEDAPNITPSGGEDDFQT